MDSDLTDEILTYWLIPAEPALNYFRSLIQELAARFDAPVFEPHVTLHVTDVEDENPAVVLERTVANAKSLALSIGGIDFSDEFTKTLFVQFRPDAAATSLSKNIGYASKNPSEYRLNPHLSLIYKTMSAETKHEIVNSLRLPFDQVRFASVKAVIVPARIESRADVEAWRVVGAKTFIG